jgi:hypothetical protein
MDATCQWSLEGPTARTPSRMDSLWPSRRDRDSGARYRRRATLCRLRTEVTRPRVGLERQARRQDGSSNVDSIQCSRGPNRLAGPVVGSPHGPASSGQVSPDKRIIRSESGPKMPLRAKDPADRVRMPLVALRRPRRAGSVGLGGTASQRP